jgi:hypothetical protein
LVYLACAILASSTFSLVFCRTLDEMVAVVIIFGGANGMYLTMDTSLAIDTLPPEDESGDGESGSAQLLGIWGVAGTSIPQSLIRPIHHFLALIDSTTIPPAAFLGSALGPMIGGPLLYIFGSTADSQDSGTEEYTLTGYAVVLGLSTFYFVASAWSLRYIRNARE